MNHIDGVGKMVQKSPSASAGAASQEALRHSRDSTTHLRRQWHVASGAIMMYNEAIDIPNKHPALLTTAGARDDGT